MRIDVGEIRRCNSPLNPRNGKLALLDGFLDMLG
jgi:hypothetical protein